MRRPPLVKTSFPGKVVKRWHNSQHRFGCCPLCARDEFLVWDRATSLRPTVDFLLQCQKRDANASGILLTRAFHLCQPLVATLKVLLKGGYSSFSNTVGIA